MAHYYDARPTGRIRELKIPVKIKHLTFELVTASGLFSLKHVDPATQLLIEKTPVPKESKVLDLGCGYGVVGIAVKKMQPSCTVFMTDINSRACKYAKINVKKLGLDIRVINSDVLSEVEEEDFDVVMTNPPYVAGRDVCIAFVQQAHAKLKKGGSLFLVARHTKGGKFLSQVMEEAFGNVEDIARQGGFRVYHSVK